MLSETYFKHQLIYIKKILSQFKNEMRLQII